MQRKEHIVLQYMWYIEEKRKSCCIGGGGGGGGGGNLAATKFSENGDFFTLLIFQFGI